MSPLSLPLHPSLFSIVTSPSLELSCHLSSLATLPCPVSRHVPSLSLAFTTSPLFSSVLSQPVALSPPVALPLSHTLCNCTHTHTHTALKAGKQLSKVNVGAAQRFVTAALRGNDSEPASASKPRARSKHARSSDDAKAATTATAATAKPTKKQHKQKKAQQPRRKKQKTARRRK